MKCPICNAELDQETYYDHTSEDTSYYNFCDNCGWDDYPEHLMEDVLDITKPQAEEFYRDLCVTVYGDSAKNSQGVMSIALIADHMKISIEKANAFCNAMIKYGITERQNGMVVV